jgi:hypothetical protein
MMSWAQFLTALIGLLAAILGSPLLREAVTEWRQNRRWQRFRRELAWRLVDILASEEILTPELARVAIHQSLFDAGYRGDTITPDLLAAGMEDARGVLYDLRRELKNEDQRTRIEDLLVVLRGEELTLRRARLTGETDEQAGTVQHH